MNGRQHIMALCLAAVFLVVVVATAAKTPNAAIRTSQVEVLLEGATAQLLNDANVTTKVKVPLRRSSSMTLSEERRGTIWSPDHDLTLTSQASIYILYTPR